MSRTASEGLVLAKERKKKFQLSKLIVRQILLQKTKILLIFAKNYLILIFKSKGKLDELKMQNEKWIS